MLSLRGKALAEVTVTQVARSALVIELVAIPSMMRPGVFFGAFGVLHIARTARVLALLFDLAALSLGGSLPPRALPFRFGLLYERQFLACNGFGGGEFSRSWLMNRKRELAAGIGAGDALEAGAVLARTFKDLCKRGRSMKRGEERCDAEKAGSPDELGLRHGEVRELIGAPYHDI